MIILYTRVEQKDFFFVSIALRNILELFFEVETFAKCLKRLHFFVSCRCSILILTRLQLLRLDQREDTRVNSDRGKLNKKLYSDSDEIDLI